MNGDDRPGIQKMVFLCDFMGTTAFGGAEEALVRKKRGGVCTDSGRFTSYCGTKRMPTET